MTKKQQINQISIIEAIKILNVHGIAYKLNMTDSDTKAMARAICRAVGKTPKQIAP